MIWSKEELLDVISGDDRSKAFEVISQLDNPANRDIFSEQNFSCLWEILGLAGLSHASEKTKEYVWTWLIQHGIINSYKNGCLSEFNKKLVVKYKDYNLSIWNKKDNFDTDKCFRISIIEEIAAGNANLAEAVAYEGCHQPSMVQNFINTGLDERIWFYLKYLADCQEHTPSVLKRTEFHEVLYSLVQIIKYKRNKLNEEEKEFFYRYFNNALSIGENRHYLGIDDSFFALLMFDKDLGLISEIEAAPGLARNQEIREFVSDFEKEDGFYDQTTALYIKYEPEQITEMVERCLNLAENKDYPRGICFVLTLLKMGQVKSGVMILQKLADKGQALGCIGYLSWLLTQAKGAETLIKDILLKNLLEMKKQCVKERFESRRLAYITQFYLVAVRVFLSEGLGQEALILLKSLAENGFLNALGDDIEFFVYIANGLLAKYPDFKDDVVEISNSLQLEVSDRDGTVCVVGNEKNNFNLDRYRIELSKDDKKVFNFHDIFDKITIINNNADNQNDLNDDITIARVEDVALKSSKTDLNKDNIDVVSIKDEQSGMDSVLKENLMVDNLQNSESKNNLNALPSEEEIPEIDGVQKEIMTWSAPDEVDDNENDKININNILDITSAEVDKHFSKIKQITDMAIKRAEDKANAIRKKVKNSRIGRSAIYKLAEATKKLKIFRKK